MISGAGGDDAITTVEGEGGWCNACQSPAGDVKAPDTETINKTTTEHARRSPASAVRNLLIVCLSCVLVLSAFRSAECLGVSCSTPSPAGTQMGDIMHAVHRARLVVGWVTGRRSVWRRR